MMSTIEEYSGYFSEVFLQLAPLLTNQQSANTSDDWICEKALTETAVNLPVEVKYTYKHGSELVSSITPGQKSPYWDATTLEFA